ncbi:MAG TPA: zinc ribbon domain-containing protein, partial [Methylomirabilota bacterium]|nr:zinc ribbon domain-containing protein [Methylomirabilota bacterium]
MTCSACGVTARPRAKFCHECGARLEWACPACGAAVAPEQKFCAECGAALPGAASLEPPARFTSPRGYTPAHLAERILKERSALEGERKQVTVLFADVSGFTSLAEALDPEEVHGLMSRAFELMLAEIHRYEGTVNQ